MLDRPGQEFLDADAVRADEEPPRGLERGGTPRPDSAMEEDLVMGREFHSRGAKRRPTPVGGAHALRFTQYAETIYSTSRANATSAMSAACKISSATPPSSECMTVRSFRSASSPTASHPRNDLMRGRDPEQHWIPDRVRNDGHRRQCDKAAAGKKRHVGGEHMQMRVTALHEALDRALFHLKHGAPLPRPLGRRKRNKEPRAPGSGRPP